MALDDKDFVATDDSLETNHAGIFAIGDVRAGSIKRVGGAIGENPAVVARIHAYLAHLGEEPPSRARQSPTALLDDARPHEAKP